MGKLALFVLLALPCAAQYFPPGGGSGGGNVTTSGLNTTGHLATWSSNTGVTDGGPIPGGLSGLTTNNMVTSASSTTVQTPTSSPGLYGTPTNFVLGNITNNYINSTGVANTLVGGGTASFPNITNCPTAACDYTTNVGFYDQVMDNAGSNQYIEGASIVACAHCRNYTGHASVMGGSYNLALFGGTNQEYIANFGGTGNTLVGTAAANFGGYQNTVAASYGVNLGGYLNQVGNVATATGTASSGSTALTVASVTGTIVSGMYVYVTGLAVGTVEPITVGTTVASVTGTAVTLSANTAGALSGNNLLFATPCTDCANVGGQGNISSGTASLTFGFGNTASGTHAVAGITGSTASGTNSLAVGNAVLATNTGDYALGDGLTISGLYAFGFNSGDDIYRAGNPAFTDSTEGDFWLNFESISLNNSKVSGEYLGVTQTTMSAPVVTATCASACTASYTYAIVAHLKDGSTVPSATTTVSNNTALLASTNFNTVVWTSQAVPGVTSYDVYLTATTGTATTGRLTAAGQPAGYTDSTGSGNSASLPSNTSGTLNVASGAKLSLAGTSVTGVQGTDSNLMSAGTISGGAGTSLCTDSNNGATTSGCPSTTVTATLAYPTSDLIAAHGGDTTLGGLTPNNGSGTDATTATAFNTTLTAPAMSAGVLKTACFAFEAWSTSTVPTITLGFYIGGGLASRWATATPLTSMSANAMTACWNFVYSGSTYTITDPQAPLTGLAYQSTGNVGNSFLNAGTWGSSQTLSVKVNWSATGIGGTIAYVSGGTISGTGTCIAAASGGGGSSGAGTFAATSGTISGNLTVTNTGYGYTAIPTSWTLTSGTATCSGTATSSGGTLSGAQGNGVNLLYAWLR